MMTAMQASSLPAAILRSGRIEVWLETRLPDEASRGEILHGSLTGLPEPLGSVDVAGLAHRTRGLTGADLKSIVEDAKLLFAHAVSTGEEATDAEHYFLTAIETIRKNRRSYAKKQRVDFNESEPIGFLCGRSDKPSVD